MGILARPLEFIQELSLPHGFSVCELGDQYITCQGKPYLAIDFYQKIGAGSYRSIDGNGRATILHDLNKPLSEKWEHDLVTDFGTGEHVFNQAMVWETVHNLCKRDGFIVFDRPSDGYKDHCFYLIQWNLIAALAHANSYNVIRLEEEGTSRGVLIRGVLQKTTDHKFVTPHQGRYHKDLKIDRKWTRRGPDYKSKALRAAGVVGLRNDKERPGR